MMVFFISFVFGAIFGSFISVLIWRLKNKEGGIFLGRSKCVKCGNTLKILDLFPIFSYLFLGGKCRYCGSKISLIYPILEIVSGFVFVFVAYLVIRSFDINLFISNLSSIVYGWIIAVFFITLAFYDIMFYEINFRITIILAILLIAPQFLGYTGNYKQAIVLAIIGFSVFILISYTRFKIRKIEGMGGGDAIGAAILGLFTPILIDILGLNNYPIWLVFYILIMLGFFLGAVVGTFGLISTKYDFLSKLPFLPFMFSAIIVFVLVGKIILQYFML